MLNLDTHIFLFALTGQLRRSETALAPRAGMTTRLPAVG